MFTLTPYKNMKTKKICMGLFLASILTSTYTFAQETVVASADTKTESSATTTPEGEAKKEEEKKFTLSGSIDTYFHSTHKMPITVALTDPQLLSLI
jgi:hypothetical protein